MKPQKEIDLGSEPIGKLFVTLAVPAIISQLVNALYNIIDRMYIGHIPDIGRVALTGVGICFPLIMIISAFASLIGMGGAPRASIHMGQGDNKSAENVLGNCFTALLIISVALTVIILSFQTPLLHIFGASENTIEYARGYMTIYTIGTIFVQITLGMNTFISAQGFSKISMLTVIIGAVINIILDPIFIFGFSMGVNGAALATVVSQAISTVWVLKFLTGKKTIIKLRKNTLKLHTKIILPVLALGVAPFIMQSTESLLVLCFNSSLLSYGGDLAVGAMTILSSIMQVAILPLFGFTQGAQPIISYNYGAGNVDRLKKAFKVSLFSCVVFTIILWTFIMTVPNAFTAMFTSDAELTQISVWALRIYMFGTIVTGAQVSCQQAFVALGNAKTSAFLALFRKIILLIPLIYILPHFFSNAVFAIFVAEPIADIIAACTTTTLFLTSFRKLLHNMQNQQQPTQ